MKRGEIYYITSTDTVGSETQKARPAVIVSDDHLNLRSPVLEVVYLTTKAKRPMPTHTRIYATGTPSTVLCEQIHTVSTERVGTFCGTCTDEEMAAINACLLKSLGLDAPTEPQEADDRTDNLLHCAALVAERDTYKAMVDKLLAILGGGVTGE